MTSAFASKKTANSMPPSSGSLVDSGPSAMITTPASHLPLPPLKSSQPITAIEMKNVIKTLDPSVIIQAAAGANGTTINASVSSNTNNNTISSNSISNNTNSSSNGTSGGFITSSNRLRLLQESTMIDTALDLDSLDGSIGNNSQSCLVKTAIV